MRFFFNETPELQRGLEQHGFLKEDGVCIRNNGASSTPFGKRWKGSKTLEAVQEQRKPYYFDRISGGFQYQDLEGIEEVVKDLEDDPCFMGFQAHEWGTSPLHDHRRIQELLLDKGLELNRENFAPYEGRTEYPFFSGGDYKRYKDLYHPLHSAGDARAYLRDYFAQMVALTSGKLVAVNGHALGYHLALELGAENIMAEIGGQVHLTAMQLAFARGSARQYSREFGFYYEPWGGTPTSGSCAIGFSTFFDDRKEIDRRFMDMRVGPGFGSTRQLHERLLYFAWLSGAAYGSEEWGAENYFSNWSDYPLTDYGRIMKSFIDQTASRPAPTPIVPAAVVFPSSLLPIDLSFIAGGPKVHMRFEPCDMYFKLRTFAQELFGSNAGETDSESRNLTSTPWIGTLDFFSDEVRDESLEAYDLVIFIDQASCQRSRLSQEKKHLYSGAPGEAGSYGTIIQQSLPFQVSGKVGSIQARCGDSFLLALFNNHGVEQRDRKTMMDPSCSAPCAITGCIDQYELIKGSRCFKEQHAEGLEFNIPPGELVLVQLSS